VRLWSIMENFFEYGWEESWTYIKTVVDVARDSILILDKDFRVMAANEAFYRIFQVEPKDTEKKIVYDLGNGQWSIPALKNLLEDIVPKNSFFKGFEVIRKFPSIGRKVMILNARRIYKENTDVSLSMKQKMSKVFPPIILLVMEDVTEMIDIAKKLADHIGKLEREKSAI